MNFKFFFIVASLFTVCSTIGFGQIPEDFPEITTEIYGETAPGNVFLTVSADVDSVGYYVFMLDNEGNIQKYKKLQDDYSYDFKMQPNGLLSYAQFIEHHSYTGGGDCIHLILDQDMNVLDSVQLKNGYVAEAHDFQILPNGHVLMFGYYMTQMDLSDIVEGGYPDAKVSGGIIQELDDAGEVVFQWRTWDHYTPEEYDWNRADQQTVSAFHLNTINLDIDGNIIFASPSFTKKLNRSNGEIMWHLGGSENEFSFIGVDSTDGVGYVTGHAIYRLENGNFLVYDNAGRTGPNKNSEVHEFMIDEVNKTAELVWTYAYPIDIGAWHRGNAYRLPNGNTIIGWGGASGDAIPTCTEIDMDGNILFEVYFNNPEVESYRAFRFPMGDWEIAEALVTELGLGNTYGFLQGDTLDTGVKVEITSMSGGGYNELVVATFDQAPVFPRFSGKDPMLTAQRVTMDPAYFYFTGNIFFDTGIFEFENPEDITVYFRQSEGQGDFIPLNTSYNFVTGLLMAQVVLEGTDKSEFAFGFKDLETIVFEPMLTSPKNEAVVHFSEIQSLEWSPKGFFNYFNIQIATDEDFNSVVYENDSVTETHFGFQCENNTSYYWRIKTFALDYEDTMESDWSEVFVFHAANSQVSVVEPAAETKWEYGLDYFIEWEDNFADQVVIELLTDSTAIMIDTTDSDGAYKWTIPVETEIGCKYRIRVTKVDESSVYAISPEYFSITDSLGNDGCGQDIGELSLAKVKVYPVPASDVIKLEYSLKENSNVTIRLMDIYGNEMRLLYSGYSPAGLNLHEFDVHHFPSGFYFIKIEIDSDQIIRKIVLN
ncbi:MAG: aryl-sulfate sulfotransferase [Bacteroidales bacterium]|nr:aryl-sulfate sulfotransferase [Bacteroidales bacterium]